MFRKSVFIMLFVCLLASSQTAWAAWPWDGQLEWQSAAADGMWCNPANWNMEGGIPCPAAGPNNLTYCAVLPNQPGPRIGDLTSCTANASASMVGLNAWDPTSWGGQDCNVTILATAGDVNFNCALQVNSQADYDSRLGGATIVSRAIVNQYGGTVRTPTPGTPNAAFYGLTIGGGGSTLGNSYGMYNLYGGLADFPRIRLYFGVINIYGGTMQATDGNFVFTQNHAENKINVNGGTLKIAGNWLNQDPCIASLIKNGRIVSIRGGALSTPIFDGTYTIITGIGDFNKAWNPIPEANAVNVSYNNTIDGNTGVTLTWNRGEPNVIQHDIYFGTNANIVNSVFGDANYRGSLTDANMGDPCSWHIPASFNFKMGANYYWRIDETAERLIDDVNKTTVVTKGLVWRFTTQNGKAYNPKPGNGATALSEPLQLSWTPSPFATSHKVYFSSVNGVLGPLTRPSDYQYRGEQAGTTYPIASLAGVFSLVPGTTYYWAVDEVLGGGASTIKGDTWSFTAAAYITIEDFEDYNSTADINSAGWQRSRCTGADNTGAGALTFVITAADGKYGNLAYDNTGASGYQNFTEVNRPYIGGTVFTGTAALSVQPAALRVDFIGAAVNSAVPGNNPNPANPYDTIYVALEDTAGNVGVYYNGDPNAVNVGTWQQWYIALNDPNFASVSKTAVSGFSLGIGNRCETYYNGSTGNVRFDNIRLYASTCNPSDTLSADMDGDCDVDLNDLDIFANDWLKKATVNTFPTITAPGTPILWYKFNETSGTAVTDYGTNGYTGTVVNLATQGWDATDGRKGHNGCLYLPSGGNSYVSCPTSALSFMGDVNHATPDGGGITFATWINADLTAFGGWIYGFIVVKDVNGNDAMEIACPHHWMATDWSANNAWCGWNKNALNDGFSLGPSMPPANYGTRWNHWAFVKAPHTVSWYCNGSLLRQEADTDSNTGDPNIYGPLFPLPASAFTIGLGGYGGNWAGHINDFQVYDRALSAEEVAYLATDGTGQLLLPLNSRSNFNLDGGTADDANQIVNFEDLSVMGDQWHQIKLWP